ncbi:MAG: FadR/GntR family transcriptional regulator [Aeromicrobium sp.]
MTATGAEPGSSSVPQVGRILHVPKTAELVASRLRRQIVRGDIPLGHSLPPEERLMKDLGVSQRSLREALRILETESLITTRRGGSKGGAAVLQPDPSVAARHVGVLLQFRGTTLQDVHFARSVSESACARLLAERSTPDDVAALECCIEELDQIVAAGIGEIPDLSEWTRATYAFHEQVMQRCGNETLAVQGSMLAEIVRSHMQRAITLGIHKHDTPDRFRSALASFRRLTRFVRDHEAGNAERHWREHMERAAEHMFAIDSADTLVIDLL